MKNLIEEILVKPLENIVLKIFTKPEDLFKSPEDEINKMFQEAAERQKEEELPRTCIKCGDWLPDGWEGEKCNRCLLI